MDSWKQWVFRKAEKMIKTASTPLSAKELAWRAINFAVDCGQSNPFSYALRPVASYGSLRQAVGLLLACLVVITAVWGPIPSLASDTGGVVSLTVLPENDVKLSTRETVKWPSGNRDISQRFWLIHPGIDIRMPTRTPINPVMSGRVSEIELGQFGYGIKVMVNHEDNYRSLYAHLSEVKVKVGEDVNTDNVIGLSGNTGRSTGPHLHLEIHHNSKPINPMLILGNK